MYLTFVENECFEICILGLKELDIPQIPASIVTDIARSFSSVENDRIIQLIGVDLQQDWSQVE